MQLCKKRKKEVIKKEGKFGVKATVLCDSISEAGVRITTFELEYPRMVHSEFLTHCMFARNAASSRAIPAAKMREQLTARPVRFGKNVSGMQDAGEHNAPVYWQNHYAGTEVKGSPEAAWEYAKSCAIDISTAFAEAGYHKQVFNRLTEPFQMIKVVCTATEFNNFFWLRDHDAADPTIEELAKCMRQAREQSTPRGLKAGEWHLPYVVVWRSEGVLHYGIEAENGGTIELSVEEAIKVSAARSAAVSFRNVDYNLEKCEQVHGRLVGDERKHSSAMEHQATPITEERVDYNVWENSVNVVDCPETWQEGVTHMDRKGQLWSAKFRGWIMYRKMIPGENMEG